MTYYRDLSHAQGVQRALAASAVSVHICMIIPRQVSGVLGGGASRPNRVTNIPRKPAECHHSCICVLATHQLLCAGCSHLMPASSSALVAAWRPSSS